MLPHALSERRVQPRPGRRAARGHRRDRAGRRAASRARRASTAAASAPTPASTTTGSTRSSPAARGARSTSPSRSAVAREAAAALGERRGTTSLDVESFEPEFRFDAAGEVTGARAVAQTESHRLIERLMILANEQVAQLLERKRVPAIYRVHAQPDPPRVERLIAQLHALGVPTPPLREGARPARGGRGRGRGEPAGAARGRAARARPRGVYIARAPLPQTGPLQRAQQRPRRARQPRLLPLHLADPPLPGPGRPPGAAGGAGRGGGGAARRRGAGGRRALQRAGARVGADRARSRRRLRRLPARARAARARRGGASSRERCRG